MKQWYDAGYFTMDLMVCRACDTIMLPLGKPNETIIFISPRFVYYHK